MATASPFRLPGARHNKFEIVIPSEFKPPTEKTALYTPSDFLPEGAYVRAPRGAGIDLDPPLREVPEWMLRKYGPMSTLEAEIIRALDKLGKRVNEQYLFQSEQLRGEYANEFGYSVVDFTLIDTDPYVAMPANGNYWHYLRGSKIIEEDLAKLRRIKSELGYDVVVIDEDDVKNIGALTLVRLAYMRVDYSQLSGRI